MTIFEALTVLKYSCRFMKQSFDCDKKCGDCYLKRSFEAMPLILVLINKHILQDANVKPGAIDLKNPGTKKPKRKKKGGG